MQSRKSNKQLYYPNSWQKFLIVIQQNIICQYQQLIPLHIRFWHLGMRLLSNSDASVLRPLFLLWPTQKSKNSLSTLPK